MFNKSLFRTFGADTQQINSSVMIAHPLRSGLYKGIVYRNDKQVGEFAVNCQPEATETQADIDLSAFEKEPIDKCGCHSQFQVKQDGYVFFFSSTGADGFYVELFAEEQKEAYNTRELRKGDIVVSMLMRPGTYEITGANSNSLLTIEEPEDKSDYEQYISRAITLSLTERGFSDKEVKVLPGQGLVITLETDSNILVKLLRATPHKETERVPRWTK
jgi:hypothetical protein